MKFLHTISLLVLLSFLCQCNKSQAPAKNKQNNDSTTLRIALIPTLDCLPFSLAAQSIYDSLGIQVETTVYLSMDDAEQAFLQGKAMGCATDMFRTIRMQRRKHQVKFAFCTPREWNLVVCKRLRVNRISQLADRVIGMERQATTDNLCDYFTTKISPQKKLLRAQIGNLYLRQHMMHMGQLDAAILPHPWTCISHKEGDTVLPLPSSLYEGYDGVTFKVQGKDSTKIALIQKGYDMAVAQLLKMSRLDIPSHILRQYHLEEILDSIMSGKAFHQSTTPSLDKLEKAKNWIEGRFYKF